ncbi:MAG: DUF397 domain-containing protein [Candidatus Falkowbacteria bacterium]
MKKFEFPVDDSQFIKASGSMKSNGGGGGDICVLVAKTELGVAVRDSKDPDKETLYFTTQEFDVFKTAVKAGEFD